MGWDTHTHTHTYKHTHTIDATEYKPSTMTKYDSKWTNDCDYYSQRLNGTIRKCKAHDDEQKK